MKIFIKLLIFITVLACIGPFMLKGPDGKALLSMDKIQFPELSFWADIKNKSSQFFYGDSDQQKLKTDNLHVYKWIDKKGVTHYSDQSDPQYKAEFTEVKQLNILPSQKMETPEKPATSNIPVGVTTIPLQDISKLIDDTKQVKKLMEGRGNQIEQALH